MEKNRECSKANGRPRLRRANHSGWDAQQVIAPAMTTTELREAVHAVPFRPFVLRLADGREYPVPHPDYIAFNRNGRTIVVVGLDDSHTAFDLLLVDSLEFGPPEQ